MHELFQIPCVSDHWRRVLRRQGLQQLRSHRHGNHLGLLAMDARHADRASHLRQLGRAKATFGQPVREGGPFGLAANQADEGQVLLLPLAAQAGSHYVQVFGVAEAHDEHPRARW